MQWYLRQFDYFSLKNSELEFSLFLARRAVAVTLTLASVLASHLKVLRQLFCILWARHCQVSYPVQGQALFPLCSKCFCVKYIIFWFYRSVIQTV